MYTPTVSQNKRGKDVVGLPQDLWNALDITGTFGGITRPSGQLFTKQYDDLLSYAQQMAGSGKMSPELMSKYGISPTGAQRQGISTMRPNHPLAAPTYQGIPGQTGLANMPPSYGQSFSTLFNPAGQGAAMAPSPYAPAYGQSPYGYNPYSYGGNDSMMGGGNWASGSPGYSGPGINAETWGATKDAFGNAVGGVRDWFGGVRNSISDYFGGGSDAYGSGSYSGATGEAYDGSYGGSWY